MRCTDFLVNKNVVSIKDKIHPSAVIHPQANIHPSVQIGPYSIVGKDVSIGKDTIIGSHVNIEGWATIGENNLISTGAVIGNIPQDQKFQGEKSHVIIGDNNIIREYVTINRGTSGGGGYTKIGNDNLLMTYVHIAHDVKMGDYNVISNSTQIAGHVEIDNRVTIGALTGLHQFVKVGSMAMVGALSKICKDIAPYTLVNGNPAKLCGLNYERMRRRHFSRSRRYFIRELYSMIFQSGLSKIEALSKMKKEYCHEEDAVLFIDFLQSSSRGIYREQLS